MYGNIQFEQHVPLRVFLSVTADRKVQCPRVGLEFKIYDTPAGGIHASQGTFSSYFYPLSVVENYQSEPHSEDMSERSSPSKVKVNTIIVYFAYW